MSTIPHTMKAARLASYEGVGALTVRTVPVPSPGPGQVVVRVAVAPVHRADRRFCEGRWGAKRSLPTTPGLEGAGTVVGSGRGLLARWWRGRRVAFLARTPSGGSWAEYAVVDAADCVPLGDDLSDDEGASLLLSSLAALSLVDRLKGCGRTGVLVTGASGALGRSLLQAAHQAGLASVGVVRRAEVADTLRAVGADEVVVLPEGEAGHEARLRRACRTWSLDAAVDALGGATTGRLLRVLPDGGEVVLVDGLSGEPAQVGVDELLFRGKELSAFFLPDHLASTGRRTLVKLLPRLARVARAALTDVPLTHIPLPALPERLASDAPRTSRWLVRP